jgi:hypothetical protein
LNDSHLAPFFITAVERLDALYRYESADFILVHNRRKTHFQLRHSPEAAATQPLPGLRAFVGGVPVGADNGVAARHGLESSNR